MGSKQKVLLGWEGGGGGVDAPSLFSPSPPMTRHKMKQYVGKDAMGVFERMVMNGAGELRARDKGGAVKASLSGDAHTQGFPQAGRVV